MQIRVKVPATSANFGSGFDSIGMALNLYNYFVFELYGEEKSSLTLKALHETYRYAGVKPVPCAIYSESYIPNSRGLGSSATCVVAGIVAANEIIGNKLSDCDVLKIATKIEGHPDNVAPCIYGGIQVSNLIMDNPASWRLNYCNKWDFVALIPEKEMNTKDSRSVLPDVIGRKYAVQNLANFGSLIGALQTGDETLLKAGLKDNLHQPFRLPLIPDWEDAANKAINLGALGVYLSGSGSTLMAVVKKDESGKFAREWKKEKWSVKELKIEEEGYKILKGDNNAS